MNKKLNICIIGFGRFGQLMADILRPFGTVFVISSKKIDNKNYQQIDFSELNIIDVVVPAVPISALMKTLKKINPFLKKGSLVIDVSSVKVMPCRALKKYIKKDVDVIGTHPMFGPDSAKNGLKGLQIVICPLRQSAKKLNWLKQICKQMGLKIIITTPENHDKQAAFNLALVHFIGRALALTGMKPQEITTKGFERLLAVNDTVNNDTFELFLDMQHYNPYSNRLRKKFIKSLNKLEETIKS